uniref:Uncharacterized protein n=1 Tax=Ascaris lumbricoides TaxID=6252 RepID=A0A0M3I117_ASCLU
MKCPDVSNPDYGKLDYFMPSSVPFPSSKHPVLVSEVGPAMRTFLALVLVGSLFAGVFCQELAEDFSPDKRGMSSFAKRARFNFAKRYPSRFAFAKRFDYDDWAEADKRAMRFAFAKRSMRNFAFAKRSPYSSFA